MGLAVLGFASVHVIDRRLLELPHSAMQHETHQHTDVENAMQKSEQICGIT